jgi:hypothetical protein
MTLVRVHDDKRRSKRQLQQEVEKDGQRRAGPAAQSALFS